MSKIEKLLEFLESSPADNFLRHALALEYIKAGNETEAQRLFEAILTEDPAYTGSYYHLAKVFERRGDHDAAISWYQKGLDATTASGDKHAWNELRMALDDITDEE